MGGHYTIHSHHTEHGTIYYLLHSRDINVSSPNLDYAMMNKAFVELFAYLKCLGLRLGDTKILIL